MMAAKEIVIAGGGPAGAAAAIAAIGEGAGAEIFERTTAPRHKVCGEFISPQACEILSALDCLDEFHSLAPHRIRRCALHLGRRTKTWTLAECAWGLSRRELDRMLLEKAEQLGAAVHRGEALPLQTTPAGPPVILACGREPRAAGRDRLFGFKAHFSGPSEDSVDLFFHRHGYAGVSAVEGGATNVCGIAPESALRRVHFDFDALLRTCDPLCERLRPLNRTMDWIATGPVAFRAPSPRGDRMYPAGDALGFVDPYTGSGILNALLTGRLAGIAAARGTPVGSYIAECRKRLSGPYLVSSVLRYFAAHAGTHWLAGCIPGRALFEWTRAGGAVV